MESIPGFNLRAQVVGQGGMYVKHIQSETRCKVQIKGRGSGFMENSTGQELDEPMFLHVAGPDQADVDRAKELCVDLLDSVRKEYQRYKENPPQRSYEGFGGGGGGGGYGNKGGDRDRDQNRDRDRGHGGHGGGGYAGGGYGTQQGGAQPSAASPVNAAGGAEAQEYAAQVAQYYAQNGGQDPYAAYGGYQQYFAYCEHLPISQRPQSSSSC